MLSLIRSGSKVAVITPSSPPPRETYLAGLAILKARYDVVELGVVDGDDADRKDPFPYLAVAEDRKRAELVNQAIEDRSIEAIFCGRGGFGSMRLLPFLNAEMFRKRNVPLLGFSDITALHAWAKKSGVPTIHGPVVTQLPALPVTDLEQLFKLLELGDSQSITNLETINRGQGRGTLIGGNMTVFCHLAGSDFFPDQGPFILLLEDIGEAPYRLDRLWSQLELSGFLKNVVGIVLGDFTDCDREQGMPPRFIRGIDVLRERIRQSEIPAVCGAPIGHGTRNVPVRLGTPAFIDADQGIFSAT